MYIDYEYYASLYKTVPQEDFPRLCLKAQRKLDNFTTGIDGVRKLACAFPVDEDTAQLVKACMAELINAMYNAEKVQNSVGITATESGVHSNVVTSVSAGNESVHYAALNTADARTASESAYKLIIYEYLSGAADANGVNLLYMGRYPYPVATK